MYSDALSALGQAALYYCVMLTLFRFRSTLGIGTFFSALCALTFVETYVSTNVYVMLAGMTYTPGSVILFAGKLPLLLLVYIREDAETVRQPIYGLFIGNLLIVALLMLIDLQTPAAMLDGADDVISVTGSSLLTVWGTVLLFADSIAVILLYEKLSRLPHLPVFVKLLTASAIVLAIDHVLYFTALHIYFGVPVSAIYGGLIGKMVAAFFFCGVIWGYLRFAERTVIDMAGSICDVFSILTYRQRYEALRVESRIDPLTGARNRLALRVEGERLLRDAHDRGDPFGVLLVDLDYLKAANDTYGHAAGDRALRYLAEVVERAVRSTDRIYRIGGDEFIVLLPKCRAPSSAEVAEQLTEITRRETFDFPPYSISASVGWADLGRDGTSLDDLMAAADRRLYATKSDREIFDPPKDSSPAHPHKRRPPETGRGAPLPSFSIPDAG